MNAVYAAFICVAGALICTMLRPQRPELAIVTAIATGTAALMICIPDIKSAAQALDMLAADSGFGAGNSAMLLRACGISLIAEFAGQICTDAGESALAGRIKLAAKLALLVMAIPMVADILLQSSLLFG